MGETVEFSFYGFYVLLHIAVYDYDLVKSYS